MNRIILIGNGFDLAHGMKTSYRDFIDDYWLNLRIKCKGFIQKPYEDDEIKIGWVPTAWQENDCYNYLMERSQRDRFSVEFKNRLIGKLSKLKGDFNWVDIEDVYYQLLKDAYRNEDKPESYKIDDLNKDFSVIKRLFQDYLLRVQEDFTSYYKLHFSKMNRRKRTIIDDIYGEFSETDFDENTRREWLDFGFGESREKFYPNQLLFLNFNYTDTHSFYTSNMDSEISVHSIHIHGELNNPENEIIFGFGDELDEDYKEIENLNDNRYLENIKSIRYLESDSYKKLLNFIHSDKYQIFVFGHSCGNSDRTLLNTLFEHKNCCSIKPYYRQHDDGSNNYSEIVRNISRSFRDKAMMRDRLVNKSFCVPLFN